MTRLSDWLDGDVSRRLSPRAAHWIVGSLLVLTGFAAGCGVMSLGVGMGMDRAPQQVIVVPGPSVDAPAGVAVVPDGPADCGTGCRLISE